MSAVKRFYKSHNIAVFLFCFVVLYNIIFAANFKLPQVSWVVFSYHAVDFSMGFCSKLIVGSLYNLFFNVVKDEFIILMESVVLTILFAGVSFLLEHFINSTKREYKKIALICSLFFLTGPCTFSMYVLEIGMFDVYWVLGCVLFFYFMTNKKLYVLTIPLFLVVLMVHYGSIFAYIPFMVIIMLYKLSCCDDKKERRLLWFVAITSSVAVIGLFVYLLMFEMENVTYSFEDFRAVLKERGVTNTSFYDYSFYHESGEYYENLFSDVVEKYKVADASPMENLVNTIMMVALFTYTTVSLTVDILPLLIISPIMLLIYKCLFFIFKSEKNNKVKRFSLFCMFALFWFTYIVATFTSMDDLRWITHSFFPLFCCFLYICYIEKDRFTSYCFSLVNCIPKPCLFFYFLMYAVLTIYPYT
ncbi:MAG: hypothetical protein IJO24_09575 [Clostridia bacterium]|nr:hypothetical protein [Clostridia bacterium]